METTCAPSGRAGRGFGCVVATNSFTETTGPLLSPGWFWQGRWIFRGAKRFLRMRQSLLHCNSLGSGLQAAFSTRVALNEERLHPLQPASPGVYGTSCHAHVPRPGCFRGPGMEHVIACYCAPSLHAGFELGQRTPHPNI